MTPDHAVPPDQASHLLRLYLKAKDENRPHFIADAFDKEAVVEMALPAASISVPSRIDGIDAITNVLVRDFGRRYENAYTFFLDKPDNDSAGREFSCDWMVVMSEKKSGAVRVGCGRYDWEFRRRHRWIVRRLGITIAAMQVLPPNALPAMLDWIHGLGYPWATNEIALAHMPGTRALDPVRAYLCKGRPDLARIFHQTGPQCEGR